MKFSGKDYWSEKTASYLSAIEGPYHANRLQMVEALLSGLSFAGKNCLDFGCGDGVFAERLLEDGAKVSGVDVDSAMIDAAQSRLLGRWKDTKLVCGGVEHLSELPDDSFDCLFALNVLAYLNPEEEATFYQQARRLLKAGGALVVTHSNELFDMFTLNRYTVNFFGKHFSMAGEKCNIRDLLVQPDVPDRYVFGVRENPLAYRYKLNGYGFSETRQEFAILHSLPPLLTPSIDFDDIDSRQYPETVGWPEDQRWKLMFMCSVFGSISTRTN